MWFVVAVQAIGPDRLRRWLKTAVVVGVASMVLVPAILMGAVLSAFMSGQALLLAAMGQAPGQQCRSQVTAPNGGSGSWSEDQRYNAAAIVRAGIDAGIPARGWVVAVATVMQESSLHNLPYGDAPGYVGLFQQYVTWGPLEVRMDPAAAAGLFYQRLVAVAGWETMPLTRAAQTVQGSAYPDAYAKWEDDAQELVNEVGGGQVAQVGCGGAGPVDGWQLPLPAEDIVPPMREHHDHPAVDIGVTVGTPVFAMRGGTVIAVNDPANCGYGVGVIDAEGAEWIYCHASRLTAIGGTVAAGQEIMLSGGAAGAVGSGSSTGPHLHVQVRVGGSLRCVGKVIDALALGQVPPSLASLSATQPCVDPA